MSRWTETIQRWSLFDQSICDESLPGIEKFFILHSNHTIQRLLSLLRLEVSEDQREVCLRRLLDLRWRLIRNTNCDYTFQPDLAANQFCLEIAKTIHLPKEPICQILMPTIQQSFGSSIVELLESTEVEPGEFHPHLYLTHSHERALIDVISVFQYAVINPALLFSQSTIDNIFELTETDRAHIRTCFPELYDWIRKKYIFQNQGDHLGFALRELQKALHNASRQKNGNEMQANTLEYAPAVHDFHRIWMSLDPVTRDSVKQYRITGASEHNTLEMKLLRLFLDVNISMSEEEMTIALKEKEYPCVDLISGYLDELLKESQCAALYAIKVPAMSQTLPACSIFDIENNITELMQKIEMHLTKRSRMNYSEDERLIKRHSCYLQFTLNNFDPKFIETEIRRGLEICVSYQDFLSILEFTPKGKWTKIANELRYCFEKIFPVSIEEIPSIYYVLMQLEKKDWKDFLEHFNSLIPAWLTATSLAKILNHLTQKERVMLVHHMGDAIHRVIVNFDDLVFYLNSSHSLDIENRVLLIMPVLEKLLIKPIDFFKLYRCLRYYEFRDYIYQYLEPYVSKIISSQEFLLQILLLLNSQECGYFLKYISSTLRKINFNPETLHTIFLFTAINCWHLIFQAIGKNALLRCLCASANLSSILSRFQEERKVKHFLTEGMQILSLISVNAEQLYIMMLRYHTLQPLFVSIFQSSLIPIFLELTTSLDTCNNVSISHYSQTFCALSEKLHFFIRIAMPTLLSFKNLKSQCPSLTRGLAEILPIHLTNQVASLEKSLVAINNRLDEKNISVEKMCQLKLFALFDFICFEHSATSHSRGN